MTQESLVEAMDIIRDLLRVGEHDGPCRNFLPDEDDPDVLYNQWDSCALHLQAAEVRRDRAQRWLDGESPTPPFQEK